ncbi:MAG: hypothetical protein V1659_00595 [Candidatus Woesearchaeota archaeon]
MKNSRLMKNKKRGSDNPIGLISGIVGVLVLIMIALWPVMPKGMLHAATSNMEGAISCKSMGKDATPGMCRAQCLDWETPLGETGISSGIGCPPKSKEDWYDVENAKTCCIPEEGESPLIYARMSADKDDFVGELAAGAIVWVKSEGEKFDFIVEVKNPNSDSKPSVDADLTKYKCTLSVSGQQAGQFQYFYFQSPTGQVIFDGNKQFEDVLVKPGTLSLTCTAGVEKYSIDVPVRAYPED